MIEMQYNSNNLQGSGFASSILAAKYQKDGTFTVNEPISVLDTRSPSPSTSTSTFSSFNPQPNMIVNEPPLHNAASGLSHWVCENPNFGLRDWVNLSKCAGKQDEILKLLLQDDIVGFEATDKNSEISGLSGSGLFPLNEYKRNLDSNSSLVENNGNSLHYLAPYVEEFETLDHKAEIFNPQGAVNSANPYLQPLLKVENVDFAPSRPGSLNIKAQFLDQGHQLLHIKQQILPHPMVNLAQQEELFYEQVYKAAELIEAGDFSNAQEILARLNQFLAPIGKPFIRSAFYVKEALELALLMPKQEIPSPFDGMFKMGAYKVFSEISPVIHFLNFTANQIFLEALGDVENIHIIDFDIGFGAHWSSFLQELPRKNRDVISVKITAFASPTTHHSLEITLMHENLTQFANELGIKFELEVVNIDCFNPNCNSSPSLRSSEKEAIVVNLPLWSFTSYMSSALPSYLCLIKRLSPKILVSLGRGSERIDLPFSHHVLDTLQYNEALFDSVDSANVTSDTSSKIEKFLFQPRIESTILGRLLAPRVMTPWRNVFASVGYTPVSISNFVVTQAECVLKTTRVRGFRVERKQASLILFWKGFELFSVCAWSC